MTPIEEIIIEKIKKEGPITFETFMDMALYYPELGYYSSPGITIGRKGDFYTSPHLHPIFGAMLAKLFVEMWTVMGKPCDFYAVEIGAGVGYLSKDILDYLHKSSQNSSLLQYKSDFLKSLRYVIVEPFEHFKKKQRELLAEFVKDITWIKSLKNLNDRDVIGCIFSNELLDAFPVHIIEMNDEIKEIYVTSNDNELVEQKNKVSSRELTKYINQFSINMQPGYRTEINLRIKDWLLDVASTLSCGFILTIDYGYSSKEYYNEDRINGTLLCYHKHQLNEDPYHNIGEQDITAHINFSSLKKWGEELGLQTIGYCPQGTFLIASGIDEIITELYSNSPDYLSEISKIKGLIMPQGMGETHRVIIQYKGDRLPELRGFSMRNLANNL